MPQGAAGSHEMDRQQRIVLSALASALALSLADGAQAADAKGKEKCYGIAKAGKNDCASLTGRHSCAGQTKASGQPDDWKYVAKGTCQKLGGMTEDEAKAASKK